MRNRTKDQIMLALIRHGETQANVQRRYLGITDEPLSERGIEQLLSYRRKNIYPEADVLFSSPMKRCVETAAVLYPMLEPVIIPEWTEMDFGRFEYKNYEELKNDRDYRQWVESGGTMDFPDGESREAFIRRCGQGFQRWYETLRQNILTESEGKTVRTAAVVHGGTIMALLCGSGGKGYFDYQAANGRGYLCRIDGGGHNGVSQDGKEIGAGVGIKEIKKI